MRALAILAVLGTTAVADPLRFRAVTEETRDPRPEVRAAAASALSKRILYGDTSRAAALVAVISNDPDVRAPLVTMLIAAHVIDGASAARIPSLATLDSMLHVLVRDPLLAATECAVATTDAHTVTIDCSRSVCRACRLQTSSATLAIGMRWTVVAHDRSSTDDERCGCE